MGAVAGAHEANAFASSQRRGVALRLPTNKLKQPQNKYADAQRHSNLIMWIYRHLIRVARMRVLCTPMQVTDQTASRTKQTCCCPAVGRVGLGPGFWGVERGSFASAEHQPSPLSRFTLKTSPTLECVCAHPIMYQVGGLGRSHLCRSM
jgi:hypothetical protein